MNFNYGDSRFASSINSSNFALKWDNTPADYGVFFDGSEVRLRFYFAVGRYPLAPVVTHHRSNLIKPSELFKTQLGEKRLKKVFFLIIEY